MNLFPVFPMPIGVEFYEGEIKDELLEELRGLERRDLYNNQSTISSSVLDEQECLSEIKKFIDQKINEYLDEVYAPLNPLEAYVTHSWITFTKAGQGHHMHTHPNSFISGVFYLKANDMLVFSKSDGYPFFEIVPREWNEFNATEINVETETGKLLLFPSKLLHHVPESLFEGERVAIAFNVFIRGTIGSKQNLSELTLL